MKLSDLIGTGVMSEPAHTEGQATYDPAGVKGLQKYLARHRENKVLADQMGVYFYELCELRRAMGRDHLTTLLGEQRKARLDKLKGTRDDHRKDHARKGRGRVRGDGNG